MNLQPKLTERLRKVLHLAKDEANKFNHDYIGTEHILLGIIREREGVAVEILKNLGVNLDAVKSKVLGYLSVGPSTMVSGNPPLTPKAERAIELAFDEARAMKHNHVDTAHILYGLVSGEDNFAYDVLKQFHLNGKKIKKEIQKICSGKGTDNVIGIYPFIDNNNKTFYIPAGSWKEAVNKTNAIEKEGIKNNPLYSIKPNYEKAMKDPDKYTLPPLFQLHEHDIQSLKTKGVNLDAEKITFDLEKIIGEYQKNKI